MVPPEILAAVLGKVCKHRAVLHVVTVDYNVIGIVYIVKPVSVVHEYRTGFKFFAHETPCKVIFVSYIGVFLLDYRIIDICSLDIDVTDCIGVCLNQGFCSGENSHRLNNVNSALVIDFGHSGLLCGNGFVITV